MRNPFVAATALAVLLASPGLAQDDVESGRLIVTENCSGCHAVGREGESPNADAPPFRTLSSKWPLEHLEEALAEGIVVGHEGMEMPEFVFEPDDIADIIAYLHTVQDN